MIATLFASSCIGSDLRMSYLTAPENTTTGLVKRAHRPYPFAIGQFCRILALICLHGEICKPMDHPAPISFYNRYHLLTALKVVLIVVLLAATAYLFMTEEDLFRNPQLIKIRVLSWGAWGPIAFMLLYAFGPSLLVPGAVMTLAAGLAFGTVWGSVYSIIGADLGALVAFGAGRFLGKGFVNSMF